MEKVIIEEEIIIKYFVDPDEIDPVLASNGEAGNWEL